MTELKRVVFDLDGTLIPQVSGEITQVEVPDLRSGAKELLNKLKEENFDLVLWTTSPGSWVEKVFGRHPDLEPFFSQVITADNMGRYLDPLTVEAAKLKTDDPRRWCLETLGEYHGGGGKYPPAVGAKYLIDDVNAAASTAEIMGTFKHIFPNSKESDSSPDEWAKRVAQALLGK